MQHLTCVSIAVHGVCAVGAQGQHLIVPWPADSAVDVELVDDEVRLEPPAWNNMIRQAARSEVREAGMSAQLPRCQYAAGMKTLTFLHSMQLE